MTRYIDSNIFIHNLIGDSRLGDGSERYPEDMTNRKAIAATYTHTMIEICVCDQKRMKNPEILWEKY